MPKRRHYAGIVPLLVLLFAAIINSLLRADEVPSPARKEVAPTTRPFDPTDAYELRTIEGWPVRVNRQLLQDHRELADDTIELLRNHLYQITRAVPRAALAKLRTVPIWVEENDPLVTCMCYHPSRGWVSGHGLNPEKTRCVELGNARNFLAWCHQQPWMVLHELAHAYHHQFLDDGFENADVKAAYEAAKEAKLYENVRHWNGRMERAYALKDQQEFFAEQSEAYFGTNDFFPFVRAELKAHDPKTYEMIKAAWGDGKR